MKLSVITPTGDREHFLKGCYKLLQNQQHTDWEWLVYDTSLRPALFDDPRIKYIYDEGIVSIGEKRARLAKRAEGDAIVHFDDDDYYAPTYLATVDQALQEADFFNLYSWFSYDTKTRQVYFWAKNEISDHHYLVNPLSGSKICEVEVNSSLNGEVLSPDKIMGYGFSFAYRREVAETCAFPDCDFKEDQHFFKAAKAAGYRFKMVADRGGEAVHVIHDSNTSCENPQYRIPRFLLAEKFADFFAHIEPYHED